MSLISGPVLFFHPGFCTQPEPPEVKAKALVAGLSCTTMKVT